LNHHDISAVIDIGSNSVILLVARSSEAGWQTLEEITAVTALGERVLTTGSLGEEGMAATLKALATFFSEAKKFGAANISAVATMAARLANNTADFEARARAQGTPIHVLSAEQEAKLGFLAVAEDPTFDELSRISTVDIGGQSTELVTGVREGREWKLLFCHSFSLGTLGLRETILESERLESRSIFTATIAVDRQIEAIYEHFDPGAVVSIGATGTNLVNIRERSATWQPEATHGKLLEYEEVARSVGWMSAMTDAERANILGIEPGRERTLHIGALILERFLYALKAENCRVSNRGWRYALLDHPLLNSNGSVAN
jgi:exopolyphosphatase / guanosine-5'-triphosphate,3'-diphosphate pyrophosphatase